MSVLGFTRSCFALFIAAVFGVAACVARPLPVPPTIKPEADPELIRAEALDGGPDPYVRVSGSSGAIDPPGIMIRVTFVNRDLVEPEDPFAEVTTGDDGSFVVDLGGVVPGLFFFEALLEDQDLFFIALDCDSEGVCVEADPGTDSDLDGSPDDIDCAPDDDTLTGRRCWE